MDATSLQQFRILLQRRRFELLAQLARADEQARTSTDRLADPADKSAHTMNREFLFAQADANRRMLRAVEEALARIREGTFGQCECCGGLISLARLRAIPWARHCVACQEQLEEGHYRAAA